VWEISIKTIKMLVVKAKPNAGMVFSQPNSQGIKIFLLSNVP